MKTSDKTFGMRREEEPAQQAEERREETERKAKVLSVEDHLNRIAYSLAAINQNLIRIASALEESNESALDGPDPMDDGSTYVRGI